MTPELQDDELLRGYLLGKLPDEDADRLERRLLADDELFELAETVEFDLLAAVDRGTLTPAEREEVLQKLAASPRGRERLALARSLNTLATEKAGKSNVLHPIFRPTAIRWMALAAVLVMVAGLAWFALRQGERAPQIPATIAKAGTPTPSPTPQPSPPVMPSLAEKKPGTNPERRATGKKSAVPPAVLTLSFLTSRGAEERPQLEVARGIRRVEIQIDADGLGDAKSFDVVIRTRERGVLLEKKGLAIGAQGLVVRLPADRLSPGRYEIAVTPKGGEEISQEFEVVEGER